MKKFPDGKRQIFLYNSPIEFDDSSDSNIDSFSDKSNSNLLSSDSEDNILDLSDDELNARAIRSANVSSKRSLNIVYDLCRANTWEYLITLTFNRDLVDSSDYDLCVKKLQSFLRNFNYRYCNSNLKYIFVPELHADGIHYHFHGLLSGLPSDLLIPSGVSDSKGRAVFNLKNFKLGFTNLTKVSDSKRVSIYICKYITKNLSIDLKGRHRYLCSSNLERPVVKKYMVNVSQYSNILKNLKRTNWACQKSFSVNGYDNTYSIFELD